MLSILNESKVWSVWKLTLGILIPVTNYLPAGEPGAQADQLWVIRSRCSEELICADVTLISTCGEVPVGQREGVIADQPLQRTEKH